MLRTARIDPQAERFVRYFERCSQWRPLLASDALQVGGALPVFVGRRRYPQQYGMGFMDWLRRLAGWALPVALSGASTFLGQTRAAQAEGKTLSEAAKSALAPTAQAVLGETATQISKAKQQRGGGPKRRKRRGSAVRFVLPGRAKAPRLPAHAYKSSPPAGPSVKYNF